MGLQRVRHDWETGQQQVVSQKGMTTNSGCTQLLSRVRLSETPWTAACQAPLSVGLSRQEYWSGLPFLFPGDPSDPGVELQVDSLPLNYQGSQLWLGHPIFQERLAVNTHIHKHTVTHGSWIWDLCSRAKSHVFAQTSRYLPYLCILCERSSLHELLPQCALLFPSFVAHYRLFLLLGIFSLPIPLCLADFLFLKPFLFSRHWGKHLIG